MYSKTYNIIPHYQTNDKPRWFRDFYVPKFKTYNRMRRSCLVSSVQSTYTKFNYFQIIVLCFP